MEKVYKGIGKLRGQRKPWEKKITNARDVNATISIDIQPGGEYYVEFSLSTKTEAAPAFKQKGKDESKAELKKI